jgi:hypothetical protein
MIKFFRHIRKSLIEQNQMGKYLKYAIGEILLVVIGILLALQINNWNENRKLRKAEIETLAEIKTGLNQDIEVLSNNLKLLEAKKVECRELISHVENKLPYSTKLDSLFMNVYYHKGYKTFNNSGYELLKQRGFDIIINSELRKSITKHYTSDLSDIKGILTRLEQLNLIQADNLYDNFKLSYTSGDGIMQAYEYDSLLKDPKVLGPFYHLELMNIHYINMLTEFKEKTKLMLEEVNDELLKRQN